MKNKPSTLVLNIPQSLKANLVKSANNGKLVEYTSSVLSSVLKIKPTHISKNPKTNTTVLIISLDQQGNGPIILGFNDYSVEHGWDKDYVSEKKLKSSGLTLASLFWICEDDLLNLLFALKGDRNEE